MFKTCLATDFLLQCVMLSEDVGQANRFAMDTRCVTLEGLGVGVYLSSQRCRKGHGKRGVNMSRGAVDINSSTRIYCSYDTLSLDIIEWG